MKRITLVLVSIFSILNTKSQIRLGSSTSTIYENNGKLGVGLDNPIDNIHINNSTGATMTLQGPSELNNLMGGVKITSGYPTYWAGMQSFTTNVGLDVMDLRFFTPHGATTERMRISSLGAVSIGLQGAGLDKLHVEGGGIIAREGTGLIAISPAAGAIELTSSYASYTFFDFKGNANASSDFRGRLFHDDNSGFSFYVNGGTNALRLDNSGNVGIGTYGPNTKLHISGSNTTTTVGTENLLTLQRPFSLGVSFAQNASFALGRYKYSTGDASANTRLDINLGANNATNPDNPGITVMSLLNTGLVAIGQDIDLTKFDNTPDVKLAVNGSAVFTKAKVKLYGNWPDYVFNSDYKLPSLSELEDYIKENKHLPEIPSAEEVEKNGIDLGSNQALLLKKIEELTLYIIQLNQKVDQLSSENKTLKQNQN